ncbi:MAG: cytochrome c biogenesis protein CcdA [Anaerovorax sp.]
MQYLIVFIEGIVSFISPCQLPLIPLYVAYIVGATDHDEIQKNVVLKNSMGFVLGFTLIYVILGAFAGTLGNFLQQYQTVFNVAAGLIIILFGLNFLGAFPKIFNRLHGKTLTPKKVVGFGSSVLFGIVFAVGWTPCVGAFLGSALLLAGQQGSALEGIGMLFCFSLGLGIPFLFSALLIDRLAATFDFIKRHNDKVTLLSGIFLVFMGILMAAGLMTKLLNLL